jgi:hypothetical protein
MASEGEAVLLSVQHTVYQHDIFVDVATGTYDMDCSGYVGYVLERIARRHYDTIPAATGRPLAYEFYDHFSALPPEGAGGWTPIQPLMEALPGDIVAWRSELIEPGVNTGHVFIVADEPEVLDDGAVAVPVYDSSNVLHYDDTRGQGGDSPATGVGSGTIHFRYGDAGVEFKFGPGDPYFDCPLAIGRLEPLPT